MATFSTMDLTARKALGHSYLANNQVKEAENIYIHVLRTDPQDVEAYICLGDCYQLQGDLEAAVLLYAQALKIDPTNQVLHSKHLDLLGRLGEDAPAIPEPIIPPSEVKEPGTGADQSQVVSLEVPDKPAVAQPEEEISATPQPPSLHTGAEAVMGILQDIVGPATQVTESDVVRAAEVLEKFVSSPNPARVVAEHLNEVDELLPALLELNIRQARADGRPDLAEALQELSNNIHLQLDIRKAVFSGAPAGVALPRVLFLSPPERDADQRQTLPAEALSALGCEVTIATQLPPEIAKRFDIVVAHHPHGSPSNLQNLAACTAARIPIILDLDQDYEQMPVTHPDYNTLGLGSPASSKAFTVALMLADQIRVPNEILAGLLRPKGMRVQVIADGWNRQNNLWDKPPVRRHTINLGWLDNPGQLEDVSQVRRVIIRLMREFPQVNLVIVGNPQVYQLFDSLSEARRLFLPTVHLDDYPYLFSQIDILLVPLKSISFNNSCSDRLLMEAGIRGIPWVASAVPSFRDWGVGGLLAENLEEWHSHLRQLVLDAELRASLGKAGHAKTQEREMGRLGLAWLEMLLSSTRPKQGSKGQ